MPSRYKSRLCKSGLKKAIARRSLRKSLKQETKLDVIEGETMTDLRIKHEAAEDRYMFEAHKSYWQYLADGIRHE